jgi:hypothetical protein
MISSGSRGSDVVGLIVLSQIGPEPKNDLWRLFSHQREQVELASQRYHPHDENRGTVVIQRLIEAYKLECPDMAYRFEQFIKEFATDHLNLLSPDEVLKRFSFDEIADHLSPEVLQRLLERVEQRKQN